MSLSLANALYSGNFFTAESEYINHQLMKIVSLDDENKTAVVELQKYVINSSADVYKDNDKITVSLPYDEFANLNLPIVKSK